MSHPVAPLEPTNPVSPRTLFVVGDDAQSIYAFRGSKIELILGFTRQFQHASEIVLNQNYRSTQPILDLAEQVISHNPGQKKKELFTENTEKKEVHFYHARNQIDEAEYIVRTLEKLYLDPPAPSSTTYFSSVESVFDAVSEQSASPTPVRLVRDDDPVSSMFDMYLDSSVSLAPAPSTHYSPSPHRYDWAITKKRDWSSAEQLNNTAILYRTHAQSRALEETFLKQGLPYRLVSGTKFLDRREIKDILSILKFVANGDDRISLTRFLPLLLDGIGPKTLQRILAHLDDSTSPLAQKTLGAFLALLQKVDHIFAQNTSLIALSKALVESIGYLEHLKKEYPQKDDYASRLENIGELYSLMLRFDENSDPLEQKLNRFLNDISLMTNQDDTAEATGPKIQLMSLHQSKGLEFETVFLVGVEDNLLPHSNSFMEPDGIEEEVRLAYVGITRAKRNLYLIAAESRANFGQILANPISRIFRPFLNDYTKRVF
jgi:superfamily I DNA/RNA helicase